MYQKITVKSSNVDTITKKDMYIVNHCETAQRIIDCVPEGGKLSLHLDRWYLVEIDNPNARFSKVYTEFLLVDKEGDVYRTGAKGVVDGFADVYNDFLESMGNVDAVITFTNTPSKSDNGRKYLNFTLREDKAPAEKD